MSELDFEFVSADELAAIDTALASSQQPQPKPSNAQSSVKPRCIVISKQPTTQKQKPVIVSRPSTAPPPPPPITASTTTTITTNNMPKPKPPIPIIVVSQNQNQNQSNQKQQQQQQSTKSNSSTSTTSHGSPAKAILLSPTRSKHTTLSPLFSQQAQQQQQQQIKKPPAVAPQFPTIGTTVSIELSLISRDSFSSLTGAPNTTVEEIFKSITGYHKDEKTNIWTFPLSMYNTLVSELAGLPSIQIIPIPQNVVSLFLNGPSNSSISTDEEIDQLIANVPPKLMAALFPFQKDGLRFGLKHKGRCLIADEMGLGKTLQALSIASCFQDEWPLLIICPSSLRLQWAEQIETWIGLSGKAINVIQTGKGSVANGVAVIVSYDLVQKFKDALLQRRFRVVIADESHMLKNRVTKRTQALLPLLKRSNRAILLTGTPALSRPIELFSQIEAIDSTVIPRFHEFGIRYCGGYSSKWGWVMTGATNLVELNLVIQNTVMIRRLKKNVLSELPLKRREKINIGIVKQHTTVIKTVMSDLRAAIHKITSSSDDVSRDAKNTSHRLIMELYRDSGAAKLPLVTTYVRDMLESGIKFLVFAHHQDVLDGIEHTLKGSGAGYIRIDGRTPSQIRYNLVSHFQDDPDCKVALLSITAAGVGLNLTAASLIIFAELFWNPGALRQAEDRAHRIGQTNDVTVRYLVAKNTVDEMIWNLIEKKLDVISQTLDGKEEHQEVTTVEGRQDAEECIDKFLHDILEVVDTYDQRKEAYETAKTERKKRSKKQVIDVDDEKEEKNESDDEPPRKQISDGSENDKSSKRRPKRRNVINNNNNDDDDDDDDDETAAAVLKMSASSNAPQSIFIDTVGEDSPGGGSPVKQPASTSTSISANTTTNRGSQSKYDQFLNNT